MPNIVVFVKNNIVAQIIPLGGIPAEEHIQNGIRLNYDSAILASDKAKLGDSVVNGVVFGHEPEPEPKILTKLEYMERFTDQELQDIYTAAKTFVAIEVWLEKFKATTQVDLNDPRIVAGLQALETAGLIAQGRVQEIIQ